MHIVAPQLRFLDAEALQRLHNGIAVNYVFNVRIAVDRYGKAISDLTYRFIVSYDIFEEKFAVNRIMPNPRSITHLTEATAEMWCLDSIAVSTTALADRPFWVMLEYHSESAANESDDSNTSILGQLIDVFSRPRQKQESRGSFTSGPFRMSELRKTR